MSESKRDYTTWEEDFISDRCELHGYNDELVAVIDAGWSVKDKDGKLVALKNTKQEAMKTAEGLL